MELLNWIEELYKLKIIPRTGWIFHGIKLEHTESVAEHLSMVSILSLILAHILEENDFKINLKKVLEMAILHDIPEILTFDISKEYLKYLGDRGKKIKDTLEKSATKHILDGLHNKKLSSKWRKILNEYQRSKSLESKIVHAADYFDIMFQIIAYEKLGYQKSLFKDLWEDVSKRIASLEINPISRMLEDLKLKKAL
ncbi:MAG: HD domain-containing protein [Candidatus Bathyarchaeia archaeon]